MAACRKHGIHASAAYGKQNWNLELIKPALDGLNGSWDEFMHCLMPKEDEVAEAIANQINQICELLQGLFLESQPDRCFIVVNSINSYQSQRKESYPLVRLQAL